jgi:type VI secretion system secreted protein VgrG
MASIYQQAHLPVTITTPLGPDKLLVRSFEGEEHVSGLFHYRLELVSEDPAVAFDGILGKRVTLNIPQSSGDVHSINGVVGRFVQTGRDDRFTYYSADLRPWLWLLTMSADCRIFQNMTAPDIVKKVFSGLGFSDFQDKLTGSYQPREFCVQYRESAFAFVSRLMEEEGFYYFFSHSGSSHILALADDASSWLAPAGLSQARYASDPGDWVSDDVVTDCGLEQSLTPGQYAHDDFNFETPDTDLLATASGQDASRAIYDYPGFYAKQSDGESISGRRLSALEIPGKLLSGSSRCRAFYAGLKFTLANHYRADLNAAYVIESLHVRGTLTEYSNSFTAFPASAAFRPPLQTPRPFISGSQTAIVTGKSGEEIWTEQYGRIKVKFHWDQQGASDETSSCWIRVAQTWAGMQWGGIFTPRIGQEVVVSFLEGNPDRPLVTGSVYNAKQTVPYTLPDEQTKSTLKTNSSKGGSGFNEIRFEDKAGSEELFVQAQKDMNLTVLNNLTAKVTKDEAVTVQGKRTLSITGDEAHTNQGNYSLKVSGNLTIDVSGSVTIKAGTSLENQAGTSLTNKSGADLTNDAGTTLTNKAAASQTVDGGGMLTLKGGLVKIN